MADFIGGAGSTQLLILMLFPITGAIFFAGILIVFYTRRGKKSKMKHGVQPKSSVTSNSVTESSPSDLTHDLNTSILSQPLPSKAPANELNSSTLAAQSVPKPSTENRTSFNETGLSLDRHEGSGTTETSKMATSDPSITEKTNSIAPPADNHLSAGSQSPEPTELLRLLRDPESGRLIVEIAGHRYTKLADVTDKKTGQFVLKLTANLLSFTNGMIAVEDGLKSVYNPKVGQTPEPVVGPSPSQQRPDPTPERPAPSSEAPAKEPRSPEPVPPVNSAFLASQKNDRISDPKEEAQSRGLFGRSKPAEEPQLLPVINLAEEINEIVQTRLMASSLAANTHIDITSEPGGGIRINVNSNFYTSPDDIPHPEVKQLIKASIKQWERS